MATKNVPAKKESTAVSAGNYEDRLAALAKQNVTQEASVGGGSFISVKGGRLSYQGNVIKGDELDVVILDAVMENAYYEGAYDSDNPQPPVCYAFGHSEEELAPHPESAKPQAEKCKGCPQNEFGTASQGKGKACKNIRRLALIPGDPLDEETIKKAEVAYMKVPVTSVKGYAAFVKSVASLDKLPPLGVVTTIGVVPDDKSQFKVTFQKKELVPKKLLPLILDRSDAEAEGLVVPYGQPTEEAPKSKGKPAAKRKF